MARVVTSEDGRYHFCYQCSTEVYASDKFCHQCGEKLQWDNPHKCEYCHIVNRNKGIAENLREALRGKDEGKKIEYPFMSIHIIDNSGRGISSKGFTAKFCPNCGRELET